jgi:hypothetical protein
MFDTTDDGGKTCNYLSGLSDRKSEIDEMWIKHERNYDKYIWHRNDKRSGKVLKDDMKICRTSCNYMKEDKVSENDRT